MASSEQTTWSVSGFDSHLEWINTTPSDDRIETDGSMLTLSPRSVTDFWSKTFYSPLLVKSDAPALLCSVPVDCEATVKVDLSLEATSQFDQAGLLVFIDNTHWLKCGIEYCDGVPRLSVVVTNDYSDWSTQTWCSLRVRLRIHKILQSDSIVVEAAQTGTDEYQFIRIAHLSHHRASDDDEPCMWRVGPYAASPTMNARCCATFTKFSVGSKESSSHSSQLT